MNVALNIASASKIYNSLQSFTDQFCEFLALQDIGFITLGKSALASILEQYEITVNHDLNDFFPFVNYVDEFCNTISSVIDFNYTLSSQRIFEDIYNLSQKRELNSRFITLMVVFMLMTINMKVIMQFLGIPIHHKGKLI